MSGCLLELVLVGDDFAETLVDKASKPQWQCTGPAHFATDISAGDDASLRINGRQFTNERNRSKLHISTPRLNSIRQSGTLVFDRGSAMNHGRFTAFSPYRATNRCSRRNPLRATFPSLVSLPDSAA